MIQRMLSSALFAGFAAGLLAALLQFAFDEKLILLAEQYETGALVHFAAAEPAGHDHAATPDPATPAPEAAAQPAGHDHQPAAGEGGASPLKRHGLTVLFAVLTYAGYALILVAAYALAGQWGYRVSLRDGLLWGLAGFAAFQMAPAMGLEPELPGTPAADLDARQIWWMGTAIATAAGLGLLAFGRSLLARAAGVLLLALPHVIGAPELDGFAGVTPPELASRFAARSLGIGLCVWVFMGAVLARFWTGKAEA
ncbi:MAG: CbtA family protein [Proteobacteria bacterium]|nr:CbtA family protein [Pseudomonadota bacterium]MBS0572158.1 CbtA family protein [Pseudomonadota bacterium]